MLEGSFHKFRVGLAILQYLSDRESSESGSALSSNCTTGRMLIYRPHADCKSFTADPWFFEFSHRISCREQIAH